MSKTTEIELFLAYSENWLRASKVNAILDKNKASFSDEVYNFHHSILNKKIPTSIPKEIGDAFKVKSDILDLTLAEHFPLISLQWTGALISFLKSHIGYDFSVFEYQNKHNNFLKSLKHFNISVKNSPKKHPLKLFKKDKNLLHESHKDCNLLVVWGEITPSDSLQIYREWKGKAILNMSNQNILADLTEKFLFKYYYFSHPELGDVTPCLSIPKLLNTD